MRIADIIVSLETLAPPSVQESYDNAGLITGNAAWECQGIICALDATEQVIEEAIAKKCNLVVAHHPIIFGGLKKINGNNHVERTIIHAIKNDIAIYAIHTNLDNVIAGVNGRIAAQLGLEHLTILSPKNTLLKKLSCFIPPAHVEQVRNAVFALGGGQIGRYSECSFTVEGEGTFKAGAGADPFVGEIGQRHIGKEVKLELVFPSWLEKNIIAALIAAHPYQEPAYDCISLSNSHPGVGSGLIGRFAQPMEEKAFLNKLKSVFSLQVVRHTALNGKLINRMAICGGAGSFLIPSALNAGVDAFITADMKYHEFFNADGRLLIADIGHYESEQFTIGLLQEFLAEKFPTFAVLKTVVLTNPVHYY